MARSYINAASVDLVNDAGSVLWSIVKGEQLEFPIDLTFIEEITVGYDFEAVVIEGLNDGEGTIPAAIQPDGMETVLTIRIPTNQGEYSDVGVYTPGDFVEYEDAYWILDTVHDGNPPSTVLWSSHAINRIFIQTDTTLGTGWTVQPTPGVPSYGFFELRVTENASPIYARTWKPTRGTVQLLFSPTDLI